MIAVPHLPPLILASASPRRRALLASLGLDFRVEPADIDETPLAAEAPADLVMRLSGEKARAIAATNPSTLVIAADTVVVLEDSILMKPHNAEENRHFIARLAGRSHKVYSGYALHWQGETHLSRLVTHVTMRDLSEAEIARYVATGEGLDKAGGYAIQGYGAALVASIEGCYFNVVGLSLAHLVQQAQKFGVHLV